ncbi:T9SS C-terminal target domain-containing protein [Bacteroides salyersiae]|uniref:T9SS C-terminal target domain-containing protein n=1 Tax=Bacteroides salyersiae TaxID=291644 RepID=UPI00101C79E0|nr:T9SS C-terminal target domain-containing protein [Bacteroides salyersiae]
MKNYILLFLLSFVFMRVSTQELSQEISLPRAGDILDKTQLDYTTSGASGEEVIWDFRKQTVRDDNYKVSYSGKIDSILCLSESRTQYKYRLSGDSLLFVGYENANIRIENKLPAVTLCYPFVYGDSIGSYFYGEGSYSHSLGISSYGFTSTVADGLGSLLLPGVDTLRQVLRIRHNQYIGQVYHADSKFMNDSISCLSDSVRQWLKHDPARWHVVHCQWYVPGYRYPVFETFENSIYKSGSLYKHFNTAFYYPLTEQCYLADDPENRIIRDRLAMLDERAFKQESNDFSFTSGGEYGNVLLNYMLTSEKQLTLHYQVDEPVQLEVIITTISGIVLYHQPVHTVSNGIYTEQVNLAGQGENEFVLCTIVNGQQESQKIICY